MGPRDQLTDWQFDYQFHFDLHPGPNPEPKIVVQTGCPTAKVPMSIATEIPIGIPAYDMREWDAKVKVKGTIILN